MKEPKISVIMSAYNAEKYIAEAIESILNQTFKNFEFIIINDCSTDNSLKIIKKYMKKDKRIILINNKKNFGRAKSRNRGLKIAKGKYIAILDSDDVSLSERFEKQYNFLEQHQDVFLVGTGSINIDENGIKKSISKPICSFKKISKILPFNNCIFHPSIMFRNGDKYFYREKFPYSQDYDLYLRLLSKGKRLVNMPEILIKYRINPHAVSWTKSAKQKLFAEKAKKFYHQRLEHGKEEYNRFDPNTILNINVEKSADKFILKCEIESSFRINNFKTTKIFCKRYFKHYGVFNKILIYYFLSFTGKKFVNNIRKILFN